MSNKILVGNLSTDVEEFKIRQMFVGTSGTICGINIPTDPRTGKCRGYAIVDMNDAIEAEQAVKDLNGKNVEGRTMTVSIVPQKPVRKWYQFGH